MNRLLIHDKKRRKQKSFEPRAVLKGAHKFEEFQSTSDSTRQCFGINSIPSILPSSTKQLMGANPLKIVSIGELLTFLPFLTRNRQADEAYLRHPHKQQNFAQICSS